MEGNESSYSGSEEGRLAGEADAVRGDVSLGAEATYAGAARRKDAELSLGDERTLGGGDAAGLDTVIDDIEVVDLENRYKIEGTLGQGGMGAVLLATDTRLDRKVAIKRILGEAARSKTAIMRFLTEAKAIAALNHPNIVQIYDYGRAKDGPFLIMEYVDGGSVADRCKQGALALDEAVSLACQLCDGLAKAHDAGIIHRDIKPANVLLNRDGHPKLTDFGLAKAEAADHAMTMTGAVMGTPDFMPPEQRRDAAEVDHRSDLWSLAATVYQIVTGRSPKIIRFDLLPAELTKVLGKALEEEKDARFQSAREFRDALRASAVGSAGRSPGPPVAASGLQEGQCQACGTVHTDLNRKFCRQCQEPLRRPCLKCSADMPVWDHNCGACGANQESLASAKLSDLNARRTNAEKSLDDYRFDVAAEILRDMGDASRFPQFREWRTDFENRLHATRDSQLSRVAALLDEAVRHESAHDYQAAVRALESVPPPLRHVRSGARRLAVADLLARMEKKHAEVTRLEKTLREGIAAKRLDGLLPVAAKLLSLSPNRADVAKVKRQLEQREVKRAADPASLLGQARQLLREGKHQAAIDLLAKSGMSDAVPEVAAIRSEATTVLPRCKELREWLQVADDMWESLPFIQEYLGICPADEEVRSILESFYEGFVDSIGATISAGNFTTAIQGIEQFLAIVPNESEVAIKARALLKTCRKQAGADLWQFIAYSAVSGLPIGGLVGWLAGSVFWVDSPRDYGTIVYAVFEVVKCSLVWGLCWLLGWLLMLAYGSAYGKVLLRAVGLEHSE